MTAIENANAARVRIEERLTASRLGKSTMREMDKDMLALREAGAALDALIAERKVTARDEVPGRGVMLTSNAVAADFAASVIAPPPTPIKGKTPDAP